MFDIESGKLLIVGIVALVLIGPKDLPRALRMLGKAKVKLRGLKTTVQNQMNDLMQEADVDGVKQQLNSLGWAEIAANPQTAMRGALPAIAGKETVTDDEKKIEYASPEMRAYQASA